MAVGTDQHIFPALKALIMVVALAADAADLGVLRRLVALIAELN